MRSKHLLAFNAGLITGLAPIVALPASLAGLATLFYVILDRKRSGLYWAMGGALGLLFTVIVYPFDKYVQELTFYHNLYGDCGVMKPFYVVWNQPWEILKRLTIFSDFDLMWNRWAAAPFYWVFLVVAIVTCRKNPLSQFALCFLAAHLVLGMSHYNMIIFPLFILAGLYEIETKKEK